MSLDPRLKPQFSEDFAENLKRESFKLLKRIAVLIVMNSLAFGLIIKGMGSFTTSFFLALNANLIGFNILGFTLGSIIALFPYKGLAY